MIGDDCYDGNDFKRYPALSRKSDLDDSDLTSSCHAPRSRASHS
jgi:hypothetical protein